MTDKEKIKAEVERYLTQNGVTFEGGGFLTVNDVERIAYYFANWQKRQLLKKLAKMPLDKAITYIIEESKKE